MAKKKKYKQEPDSDQQVTGTIRMHPRGFGFVQTGANTIYDQDIFIPKPFTNLAVDGDKVEVLVNSIVSNKGPEGKVISILERARSHLAGVVYEVEISGEGWAYVPLIGENQPVLVRDAKEADLHPGDRVVLKIENWGDQDNPTVASLIHRMGSVDEPHIDVLAALESFDIPNDFPKAALDEAKSFGTTVESEGTTERVDHTKLTTLTIDPETAKDFDDALSLRQSKKGFQLFVHIADASHYVTPGSALDTEAKKRCNSTYFPGTCIPMLPEALSNGLCSLNPKVKRLAVTVEMHFDLEGKISDYKIYKSVIKSNHRFSYSQAKEILDGKVPGPYKKNLEMMESLALLLKNQRKLRGSVEFANSELVIKVDENGVPTGFDTVEYDITHQMVEEFMLKANETVATHLAKNKKFLTFRVHEEPDPENIKNFTALVTSLGYKIPQNPTSYDLQNFFESIKETPYYSFIIVGYIRSMKLASYSPKNIGHYGLSLTHYCHFTSPIRRYADIIVHRILFGQETDFDTLTQISEKASERERISAKAEQNVKIIKKLRYLIDVIEKDPKRTFEAFVTRVKPFGIVFEVMNFELEGFFSLSDMHADFYDFVESKNQLVGRDTGKVIAMGDKIEVCLRSVDLVLLETKWSYVEDLTGVTKKHRNLNKKKKRKKKKKGKKI